jgi:outer membrane protein TolC
MKKTILFILLPLLFPLGIIAQTSQTLTIAQAVQLGMSNSKQLRLDTVKAAQVKAKQAQVSDAALPNVSINAGYSRLSPIDPVTFLFPGNPEPVTLFPVILNNYTTRASVSEGVFNGWKLKYAEESYGYLNQAALLDVEKDKAEVHFNILSAYVSYAKLKLSQQIVDNNIAGAKKRVEELSAQRDKGIVMENDVLKAQLFQSNLELTKSDIDNSVAVSQYNLCLLLGLPQNTTINIDTTGMFAAINLNAESAYENDALSRRSEKKASEARTNASESNVGVAKSVYYPSMNVGANYYFARPNQRIIPYVDEFRSTWDVGISLSWNLTSLYTGKHSVQDAQVQYLQAQMQTDILSDNIRMEVFQNYSGCQNAVNKISTLELAVQQAAENNRLVKVRYDQQTALMSEVLDAESALLQAQINLILQKADAQVAYYRLQKSAAELN